MNGLGKDGYVLGPIQNLYDLYDNIGGDPNVKCHADILDIAGSTAVAHVAIKNWHGMDVVDFLELIKENGQWKIIAKTYQQF